MVPFYPEKQLPFYNHRVMPNVVFVLLVLLGHNLRLDIASAGPTDLGLLLEDLVLLAYDWLCSAKQFYKSYCWLSGCPGMGGECCKRTGPIGHYTCR